MTPRSALQPAPPARPVLHLSGPKLRAALEAAIAVCEPIGGIERFAATLTLKSEVFRERLGDGRAASLSRAAFDEVVPLMPTVRRRIGGLIDVVGWPAVHAAVVALLQDAHMQGTADQGVAAFERALSSRSPRILRGEGRGEGQPLAPAPVAAPHPDPLPMPEGGMGRGGDRFLRDLAAELLHSVHPEYYPLMMRWVWDAKANTGVLREIWHAADGSDVDRIVIDVPDSYETFLVLREELAHFLSDNGIFRDMLWYVDLLCGHVYAGYINAQGGAWLKTEFASEVDPLEHTRRILGVDVRRRAIVKSPSREIVQNEP